MASLAAGYTRCGNGGASITDGTGNTAYACNGGTGALDLHSFSVASTAALTLTPGQAPAVVPGLSVQVTPAISIHLGQKQMGEYSKLAEIEEKAMKDLDEQTISVSRASTMDRLITVSLLKLARFEEVRIVAAGGSITDAVALAFRLGNGQISKDDVGTKLVNLYSIKMRNDPTKSIAAMSIYMQKGLSQIYSKRQSELFNRVEAGI